MPLAIRPLRIDDPADVDRYRLLNVRSVQVRRPFHEPRPLPELLANLQHPQPGGDAAYWVAFDGDTLVGTSTSWTPQGGDADKAILDLQVDPAYRGRGYGRELAEFVESTLDAGRRVLLAEIDLAGDDWLAGPEGRFAASLGYARSSMYAIRSLSWPADPARLDALAPALPPGYELRTYVDGLPDELRAPYGVLTALVDVDAPSGDVEWAGEPTPPEHYAQELERMRAGGVTLVEAVVLHGTDVVAQSAVTVPADPKRHIDVTSTYVHRDHRGHRIGLAVKIAVERQLHALDLPHTEIRTGNEITNSYMIGINETLGFELLLYTAGLVKRR